MMKQFNESLKELRNDLYKKHNRKQLSVVLHVSEVHVSRLLNGQANIKMKQYFELRHLLDENRVITVI